MKSHCNSVRDTYQIQEGYKVYDFKKCLDYIECKGKESYGNKFQIYQEDLPTIYKLLIYIIRDKNIASKLQLNLNKGILLSGPIGCGKTSIMHLIRPFSNQSPEYKIKTCREVSFEFAKHGYQALQPYTNLQVNQNRLTPYCFDDLGIEQQIKHFGNDCNVMAEILISRYENFVSNNSTTHLTTNLSASEIEKLYGNRLRSRMRNMFNLIAFEKSTADKR